MNKFSSLDEAFKWVIDAVVQRGERVAPRSEATSELRSTCFTIDDPRRRYISLRPRRWSFAYALGEFCWHARGSNRLDEIEFYSSRWRQMSHDGLTVEGSCYGNRIFGDHRGSGNQWIAAKTLLQLDAPSRRCVIHLAQRLNQSVVQSRDVSCATSLQFLLRDNKLEASCTMRSNDAMLGLPYDVFLFTMLQELMSLVLGVELGPYHHFVGSMHIYDSDLRAAMEILSAQPTVLDPMPAMTAAGGLQDLLQGELLTRSGQECDSKTGVGDYWSNLLSVLRYRNAAKLGGRPIIEQVIQDPFYRQLVELQRC